MIYFINGGIIMKRKLILKSLICLILVISMMIPNVVLAESIINGVAELEYTDVVLYVENNCVVPNNIILEGKSVSVSEGSIESLPSMVEELDKRIDLIEKQQPSIFLNNQPVISEDAYSLSTSFYLNSRLKLNAKLMRMVLQFYIPKKEILIFLLHKQAIME